MPDFVNHKSCILTFLTWSDKQEMVINRTKFH